MTKALETEAEADNKSAGKGLGMHVNTALGHIYCGCIRPSSSSRPRNNEKDKRCQEQRGIKDVNNNSSKRNASEQRAAPSPARCRS